MLERLRDELFEEPSRRRHERPMVISVLAIYYLLNPLLYVFSISQDKVFLNFGVPGWRFALLYCIGAPLLGYLLWNLRVRSHVALYCFLAFEVVRGARHGIWSVVLVGLAVLIYAVREPIRELFSPRGREAHRG